MEISARHRNPGVELREGGYIPLLSTTPLTHAQEAMLYWDCIAPDSAVYNVPIAFELHGELNLGALQNGLDTVVARHEILRSTFSLSDGQPRQSVAPPCKVVLKIVDLSQSAPNTPDCVREAVAAEARKPFSLNRDLMLRAAVFRLADAHFVLLLTLHHIASDGWSLGILLSELLETYSAAVEHRAPRLPTLPMQYSDYAIWSRNQLDRSDLQLVSFWREALAGLDWHELISAQRPRTPFGFAGETIRRILPDELGKMLAQTGLERGATTFMVMLAALQALFYWTSATDDITIGVAVANRQQSEFRNLIGCFVNTVPIRVRITGDATFLGLLSETREACLTAFAHQELPFSELVRLLHPRRVPGGSPFFQVQFLYQSYPIPQFRAPALSGERLDVDTGTAKFDLTVIVEKKNPMEVGFEYNTALFTREQINQLLDLYLHTLQSATQRPQWKLSECGPFRSGSGEAPPEFRC